ncbi:hypothetical protein [Aeromonas phage HJG]|uniref:Uncharacterized protein n=1 Tax=Aeromonas phage MJG TaxID=2510451 RepID=A0A5J6A0L4_9CAUD|nr:hypothetical protein [Aeromonas phage MJG]QBJ01070.1 hypothetical protein [Aeromonas phage HJG]
MTKLIVKTFPQIIAGKFVDTFAVVDETTGELIGKKAHKTEQEAQVELGSLKYFAEGLSFARATADEGASDKGLIAKANVVAAYLMFKENGGVAPVAEVVEEEEAPVEQVVETEEEDAAY